MGYDGTIVEIRESLCGPCREEGSHSVQVAGSGTRFGRHADVLGIN